MNQNPRSYWGITENNLPPIFFENAFIMAETNFTLAKRRLVLFQKQINQFIHNSGLCFSQLRTLGLPQKTRLFPDFFWLLFLIRLYLTSSLHSPLGIKFLSVKFKLGFALPPAFHLVLINCNDNGKVVAREVVELIALEHLRRLVRMQIAQCHLQLSSSSSPPSDSSPPPYLPSDSALQFWQ